MAKSNPVKCENCGKVDKTVPGHVGTNVGMRCPDCEPSGGPTRFCRDCCPTEHGTKMPPRGVKCPHCKKDVPQVNSFIDDVDQTHDFCPECSTQFLDWLMGSLSAVEVARQLRLWHEQGGPYEVTT